MWTVINYFSITITNWSWMIGPQTENDDLPPGWEIIVNTTQMPFCQCLLTDWGIHGLKSNRPNHMNRPFWQIDLANWPNSYLASHNLHSPLKSVKAITDLVPQLTDNLWASPPIKSTNWWASPSLKLTMHGLQLLSNSDLRAIAIKDWLATRSWLLNIDLQLDHFC